MRLTVSKRTDLAIRAYRMLHAADGRLAGKTIAAEINTSVAFLSQALSPLVAAGWLDSRTGPRGGYGITPVGAHVTLLQVIEAIEGPIVDGRCVLEDSACDASHPCALHTLWAGARASFMRSLADVTVV